MGRVILAVILFPVLFFTILISGCSGSRQAGLLESNPPAVVQTMPAAKEGAFAEELADYMAIPAEAQEDLHARAKAHIEGWRQFEKEARQNKDAGLRHWYYKGTYLDRSTYGVGLGNSISDLKAATGLDPSFAEAWGDLGRLCSVAGDLPKAREYLERALLAAEARKEAGRPVDDEILVDIFRSRAWVLRDLGYWQEGLAAVKEGLQFRRGDRDLVLIKGLLLAGAGRYEEATSLAVRMKPFSYPKFDLFHYGTSQQTSDYANRWIRSQALMAVGDYETARHVIGELNSYPYRRFLPHQQRFWNDVGLVAELVGDEDAGTYYAIGFISSDYPGFFPWMASNLEPLVLDVPRAETPFFTSFGGRFHVGGSILAYAASQMNMMSMSVFDHQRSLAAWRSLQALNIAERRNIRPDVVRALRGRVYFSAEDLELARRDLASAQNGFKLKGKVDPGTSLLLGLLEMENGQYKAAVPLFEEVVAEDEKMAVAWRSLGVSLVHLGREDQAERAMDRSLQLEPNSVSGLYNRGLLHLQNQDFSLAAADLDRAFRLDPENHEVQRLLQMAASGHRASGGDPREIQMLAEKFTLAQAVEGEITPAQIMAGLEADIQAFFAVPDSVRQMIGPEDQIISSLEGQWTQSHDPILRRILALAYLDRGMYENAQALLAPGWGVDLTPEEEIMLLYVDRTLGEEKRTNDLVELLLASKKGGSNPYLLMMLPQEDRKHWTETMLAKNHYYEGYSAASGKENGDAQRYARYMRIGFRNIRVALSNSQGVGDAHYDSPFLLNLQDHGGVNSAVSGSPPTSGGKRGNVVK